MAKEKIGVIGTGRMGANMARRLKEVGYKVTVVYDTHRDTAAALAKELGCVAADKLADVAAAADVVFTVVTDDRAQLKIFTDKRNNLLKSRAVGKIFVNCATISPATHVKLERLAKKVGARTLEACMASSINQARAGTLYLMCGGEKATFDKIRALLSRLSDDGKLMRYIGPSGTAAQVKALVNMIMNINTAGLAEGLGLANALGLDLKTVMEVFLQTGASSRVLVTDGDDMVNREHSCFFSAAHAAKDSGIALALARTAKLELPLARATFGQYRKMIALGLGGLDKSGVAELTFKGRQKTIKRK
jgi:3-hydroxyisobutyrate dehydrogenase